MALMDFGADVDSFGVQQHGQVDSVAICADENHSFQSEDIGQQDSIENILRLLELDGRPEADHDDPAVPNAVLHPASSAHEDTNAAPAESSQSQAVKTVKAAQPVDVAAASNPGPAPSPGQPVVNNYSWGAFRFTFKKTGKQMAVQATCPFHARNNSTGCKKSLNINPFTQARVDEQVLLLKHWCNQAKQFSLQRDHLSCPLQPASVPDAAVVEAQCIPRASKPDDVITDVDQDAAAKGPKQKPEAKAKAKNTGNKRQNLPTGAASSQQLPGKKSKGDSSSSSSSSTSGSGNGCSIHM